MTKRVLQKSTMTLGAAIKSLVYLLCFQYLHHETTLKDMYSVL